MFKFSLVSAVCFSLCALWAHACLAQTSAPRTGAAVAKPACPAILSHRFKRLQDEVPQDLCQYAGQVVLVVNTASYCGFTSQYEGLEALHERYRRQGFVVLGFPSNDFGNQEPGDSRQIADFCFNTFGVKFPMFVKSSVRGRDANPLHAALAKSSGTSPKWNFYKYLIDRSGNVVGSYSSLTAPDDRQLVADVEKALVSCSANSSEENVARDTTRRCASLR